MSFERDQSNNTSKFGAELCFTNQRNQNDQVKTGHRIIKMWQEMWQDKSVAT